MRLRARRAGGGRAMAGGSRIYCGGGRMMRGLRVRVFAMRNAWRERRSRMRRGESDGHAWEAGGGCLGGPCCRQIQSRAWPWRVAMEEAWRWHGDGLGMAWRWLGDGLGMAWSGMA